MTIPPPKHDHSPLNFPEGFLWGAATSAHQVEGNNTNSDWWAYEQNLYPNMRSGKAANQYELFEEDFELANNLGHNSHRLSIEWSRIEPQKGQFSQEAIDHYHQVFKSLKEKGFTIMLTLHHFTSPKWVADQEGWKNSKTVNDFIKFVEKVVSEYREYVDLWITINEPGIYVWQAYLSGVFPPHKKSWFDAFRATLNFVSAHKRAYKIIHKAVPNAQVGMSQNTFSFRTLQAHSILQHILVWFYDLSTNHLFYILTGIKNHDFLGINYYFHSRVGSHNGSKFPKLLGADVTKKDVSDLGWELHPEGIFDCLEDLSEYKKPIYITENGLASTNDDRRCRFLISYLKEIYHAIVSGVDVRGYFHWSLIDNFEWEHGFNPRFGLVEVDYESEKRTPRPSAFVYKDIIEHNSISHDLLRFIGHTVTADEVLKRHESRHEE